MSSCRGHSDQQTSSGSHGSSWSLSHTRPQCGHHPSPSACWDWLQLGPVEDRRTISWLMNVQKSNQRISCFSLGLNCWNWRCDGWISDFRLCPSSGSVPCFSEQVRRCPPVVEGLHYSSKFRQSFSLKVFKSYYQIKINELFPNSQKKSFSTEKTQTTKTIFIYFFTFEPKK